MTLTAPLPGDAGPVGQVDALLDELAELQGQRHAIDARIVDIVRRLDHEDRWGITGAKSLTACVEWKTGSNRAHARALVSVAQRAEVFPRCVAGLAEGRLSLDQVATITDRAADGTDAHYAQLADAATVTQLRTALSLAPKPDPEPDPPAPFDPPEREVTKTSDDTHTTWRIRLPHPDAARVDAALQSHGDALAAQWKRDHQSSDGRALENAPPFPTLADAFLRLVDAGWDADVATRPHGQRTTVVLHVDVESKLSSLHLGPALTDAERRYLSCDAAVETWFERDGQPIGCGRESRQLPRRLRRALEHRHRCCAVPGCGATAGLHAHHIWHWEDGGPTELWNLVLVCPYHHRLHHKGLITIRGRGDSAIVTDIAGRRLTNRAVARAPTKPPPDVAAYPGPIGERARWRWYDPPDPTRPGWGHPPSPN